MRHALRPLAALAGALLATSGCLAGPANPCGLAGEPEPNDSRDAPTPLAAGSAVLGCVAGATEQDWYDFVAPPDPAGGYLQLRLDQVGTGTVNVQLYTASDNALVLDTYAANDGASLSVYLAAAPGQRYLAKVFSAFSVSRPFSYRLTPTWTAVVDAQEPNDTRADARPLALGATAQGTLFAPFVKGATPEDASYNDWFKVNLAAGAATVRLSNVPTTLTGFVGVYDASATEVKSAYGSNEGAGVTLTLDAADVPTAGEYFVVVRKVFVLPAAGHPAGSGAVVPDHFTRAYALQMTQP